MSSATAAKTDAKKKPEHPRDAAREAIETVVFVVVLVLLLKLFVTEAFVIPTGSMAETLYGYQKLVTCPKCGIEFPVNSHDEVEPNQKTRQLHPLLGYCCPNCRYCGEIKDLNPFPSPRTGDRVLVLKPIYHLAKPQRGDVVVFKYPDAPQLRQSAQNYIKRAMGFGGETIAIHRGDLYVAHDLDYPADLRDEGGELVYPRPDNPLDAWRPRFTYATKSYSNPVAVAAFDASRAESFPDKPGRFVIVRKTNEQVLACMRVVWDNDHPPTGGGAEKLPPRWSAEAAANWNGDTTTQTKAFRHTADGLDWLRYKHYVWDWTADPSTVTPQRIDNFLGYNNGTSVRDSRTGQLSYPRVTGEEMWVGDLVVECEAEIGGGAEVVLELSKGASRFRATFADGKVALSRTGHLAGEIASRPVKLKADGKHKHALRFANVDCRLRVWVDGKAVDFGSDGDYAPGDPPVGVNADEEGWVKANDVDAPAGVGAKGPVTVRAIKLFRDSYYTRSTPFSDHRKADIMFVQPGHTLCLGDNSASSSDSREWGTVPDRLMLGKAVFVFWPRIRIGFIK